MAVTNATTMARMKRIAASALASPMPGPLLVPVTIQIKRGGTNVGTPMDAHIRAPSTEQITADGGQILWDVETPPGPIAGTSSLVRTNDLMVITACPSNPSMVTASAVGWSISQPEQVGGLIPRTLFRALQKIQI